MAEDGCLLEKHVGEAGLLEYLEKHARAHPNRSSYTFIGDDGTTEVSLTYAALRHRALAIAALLQRVLAPAKGFANGAVGERVVLMYPPGIDFVCAFYGCLYSGAIGIPGKFYFEFECRSVNYACPSLPPITITIARTLDHGTAESTSSGQRFRCCYIADNSRTHVGSQSCGRFIESRY